MMLGDPIFTVAPADLARLSADEAVDLLRELLWAEATALGIGKNMINVPSAITVGDGGIDAEVTATAISGGQGIMKPGGTRYQIKTGAFSLNNEANIKSLLFTEKSLKQRGGSLQIHPRVQSCLDKAGTFVAVLFGWDGPETKDDSLKNKMRTYLQGIDPKYGTANIEIWQPNQLMGFLHPYPSLALQVNRRAGIHFQTHRSWSHQDDMLPHFHPGQPQEDFLTFLRAGLRKADEAIHIHVWGPAGVGKTRLVLEAMRTSDLGPLVIYTGASTFLDSNLMNLLVRDDNAFAALLVLDECDPETRIEVWNRLKRRGARIKVVTIFNERPDYTAGNTVYLEAPPLESHQVSAIIEDYGVPKEQSYRWADPCSGSPRMAHMFGGNLKSNPQDMLVSPDTVDIWGRYITGRDPLYRQDVQQRRVVLRYLALFKRFGYKEPLNVEAEAIARLVQQADSNITWPRFQEIIRTLRTRKILQGETTLYITPHALHIKLWTEWWENYGNGFRVEDFVKDLPAPLLGWYFDMFRYAVESQTASAFVEELLGPQGPFQNGELLRTELGSRFFLALTEALPRAALDCLKRTLGPWDQTELLAFTTGRREMVLALERMAIWRPLFPDAARLLLALAEAENEPWSNNASGVFVGLFSPAPSPVAPTEAAPQERLPVLREALASSSKPRRSLALRACNQALESHHFARDVGAEYQGLHQEPQLWMPKTYGELFEAYRSIWQLLWNQVESFPEVEQQQIVQILLQRAQGLIRYTDLAEMVMDTIEALAQRSSVDRQPILEAVARILRFEGPTLPQPIRERGERLKELLIGTDYASRLKRYVGIHLAGDYLDEQGKPVDRVAPYLVELAQQSRAAPDMLRAELPWLMTTAARNGVAFGYELGKLDTEAIFLPILLEAQIAASANASVALLAGYVRALAEQDPHRWKELLEVISQDAVLRAWLPQLTWQVGLTDYAGARLLALAEQGHITVEQFGIFGLGRSIHVLSEEIFTQWITLLLNAATASAGSIALDLYHSYYVDVQSQHLLPEDLTLLLLTHPVFLQPPKTGSRDPMDAFHWPEIAKAFLARYPQHGVALARAMLEHFGEDYTLLDQFSPATAVLNEVLQRNPQEVWQLITHSWGPPIDTRAYHIQQWLRGGPISLIPPDVLWEWADGDLEERAWYLTRVVPNQLFREEGRVCLAREILVRYGDREDVRNELIDNFTTESWIGPESLHYESKKQHLLAFKEAEENEQVRGWIDEYVALLEQNIQHAKMREERRNF